MTAPDDQFAFVATIPFELVSPYELVTHLTVGRKSVATIRTVCPRCGVAAGRYCRRPNGKLHVRSGRRFYHTERARAAADRRSPIWPTWPPDGYTMFLLDKYRGVGDL